jgi:hypothetical protein
MRWPGHGTAGALFAAVMLVWLAGFALFMHLGRVGPEQSGTVLAVFPPSMTENQVFGNIILAGGRPIRPTWMPGTWVTYGDKAGFAGRLEAQGAIGAYSSTPFLPQLAGCFAYVDAKAVELFTLDQ